MASSARRRKGTPRTSSAGTSSGATRRVSVSAASASTAKDAPRASRRAGSEHRAASEGRAHARRATPRSSSGTPRVERSANAAKSTRRPTRRPTRRGAVPQGREPESLKPRTQAKPSQPAKSAQPVDRTRSAEAPTRRPSRRKGPAIAIVCACALVGAGVAVAFALGAFAPPATSPSEGTDGLYVPPLTDASAEDGAPAVAPTTGEAKVSLSAVGDNLMHVPVVNTADAAEGAMDDGLYDFSVLYQGVKDIVDTHDINFIDIETPMGGDEKGVRGYPAFNTPSDDAADIAAFGFNLATTATNHAWDGGLEGIENMNATWAEHPEVVVSGTFTSQEDRDRIRVFEKNGITFAFLAYQDYLNGYTLSEDVTWAIADSNDRAKVAEDIEKAHEQAECVIVAMSWGDEYATEPNEAQRSCAQFLADRGVDLILGFGSHVIEPVEWIEASPTIATSASEGGNDATEPNPYAGHKTLTVFSLGNFVSNQQDSFSNVEGCFTCDIVRDAEGAISIADPTWIPLVNHFSGGTGHTVYQLKNYTEELARAHDVLGWMDDPLGYVRDYTTEIIDPEVVTIDL